MAASVLGEAEVRSIMQHFSIRAINNIKAQDFAEFGIMDSAKYRAKFLRVSKELTHSERTMVVVLATAVKNRRRILTAIERFSDRPWYVNVKNFINKKCVQYTSEATEQTFSVVHIPSCVPPVSSRAWLQMTQEPSVSLFLRNLWAAQIFLDVTLMEEQKAWEQVFWDSEVKKGGPKFEKQGFNLEYWETKSRDKYLLVDAQGKSVPVPTSGYTREDVEKWIATKRAETGGGGGGHGGPGGGLGADEGAEGAAGGLVEPVPE